MYTPLFLGVTNFQHSSYICTWQSRQHDVLLLQYSSISQSGNVAATIHAHTGWWFQQLWKKKIVNSDYHRRTKHIFQTTNHHKMDNICSHMYTPLPGLSTNTLKRHGPAWQLGLQRITWLNTKPSPRNKNETSPNLSKRDHCILIASSPIHVLHG